MSRLLPCPFCGDLDPAIAGKGGNRYAVHCSVASCQAEGPSLSLLEAIVSWNRRAPRKELPEGWGHLGADVLSMVQLLMSAPNPRDFNLMNASLFFTGYKSWREEAKAVILRLNSPPENKP